MQIHFAGKFSKDDYLKGLLLHNQKRRWQKWVIGTFLSITVLYLVSMRVQNPVEFKDFFEQAARLMIPEFMNVKFAYPEKNKMAWAFNQNQCFAYTGIKRLGAIERYECGVLYRIKCWLDELGIKNRFVPEIGKCHMHVSGSCCGEIQLFLPAANP